jgi:hypothetical protein
LGYWQFGALPTAAECYRALRAVGGGSMEIRNQGQGVHAREIQGLGQLRHPPREWYAYTNLEVSVGPGQYREIDAAVVTDDRVLLVDLKAVYPCVRFEKFLNPSRKFSPVAR